MYVATKPFRYRGTLYNAGDIVPAESWPNRNALSRIKRLRYVDNPSETVSALQSSSTEIRLSEMTRAEMNEFAETVGVDPTAYSKKEDLQLALYDLLTKPPVVVPDSSEESSDNAADSGSVPEGSVGSESSETSTDSTREEDEGPEDGAPSEDSSGEVDSDESNSDDFFNSTNN